MFSVEAEEVQLLWFTVYIPEGTAPGKYRGRITIRADGVDPVGVPVSVTVYPAFVPVQGYMKTAFALMDGHLEKIYGKIARPVIEARLIWWQAFTYDVKDFLCWDSISGSAKTTTHPSPLPPGLAFAGR